MLIHGLEPRRLFAITISIDAQQNVTISGTEGNDTIWIDSGQDSLLDVFDSTDFTKPPIGHIPRENVRSVRIEGRGGHDQISIGETVEFQMTSGDEKTLSPLTIYGNDGDDSVSVPGWRLSTVYGGAGNDSLYGARNMFGESGNDIIKGVRYRDSDNSADELIDGGSGKDTLDGQGGNDTVIGGSGNDWIFSRDSTVPTDMPTVSAGTGHDKVYVFGPAEVDLGSGDDKAYVVRGSTGTGGYYYETPAKGVILGGDGKDYIRIDYNAIVDPDVGVQLKGGNHNDTLIGFGGSDSLFGGDGDDYINARGGNDYVEGNDGNDTIFGGSGNDQLDGGAGNDRIFGDNGNDTIVGGVGADVLIADDVVVDKLYADALDDISRRNPFDWVYT